MTSARDALRVASSLGDFFAIEVASGPDWTALAALIGDESLLREQVAATSRALAAQLNISADRIEQRPAASIWFLGLAARLISPPFGAAVLTGVVPRLNPDTVQWRAGPAGPIAISIRLADSTSSEIAPADALHDEVISTAIAPVLTAVGATFRLSGQVLWGNVASAVAGAATVVGTARPDLAHIAADLARQLQATALLEGTGRYGTRRFFVRTNCCLYYQLPGGGLCGDCVLRPA